VHPCPNVSPVALMTRVAKDSIYTCTICYEDQRIHTKCVLSRCSHECCTTCLYKLFAQAESANRGPALCPFCRAEVAKEDLLVSEGQEEDPLHGRLLIRLQNQSKRRERLERRKQGRESRSSSPCGLPSHSPGQHNCNSLKGVRRRTQLTANAPAVLFF
jgi:hypothetical protein